MRLKCRFPDILCTYCGMTSIGVRRQQKVLLQSLFEDLSTQIQLPNKRGCNLVDMKSQDGRYEAEDVSLGNVQER
jgi:hypothetical protein